MNRDIYLLLVVLLTITACTPSQKQSASGTEEQGISAPSYTPQPSKTSAPTATLQPPATATSTATPTPDLRVIDADPRDLFLSPEDLSEDSGYFTTGESPNRNWEIERDYGKDLADVYINSSGRIDGWSQGYKTYSNDPNLAGSFSISIVIFSSLEGPKADRMGITEVTICDPSSIHQEHKIVDIGVDADLCYIHLDFIGVGFMDYYSITGIYRNILFGVTATGPENTLSENMVIDMAVLLVDKLSSFPLSPEVTYTAY